MIAYKPYTSKLSTINSRKTLQLVKIYLLIYLEGRVTERDETDRNSPNAHSTQELDTLFWSPA